MEARESDAMRTRLIYRSILYIYTRERNMTKKKEDKSRETCRKNTYEFCALLSGNIRVEYS